VEGLGSPYDSKPYNLGQKQLAIDSLYGFIDLRAINPNWERWRDLGYTETPSDDVHSNEAGGDIIGTFIFRHFNGEYDNEASLFPTEGLTGSGTTNRIPFFNSASTLTSTGIIYDGETTTIAGNNVNNIEIGSNNWANINTVSGTSSLTFWSEYDSNDSRFELTATGSYPARWQSTTTIPLEISKGVQGSVGDPVTFSRIMTIRGSDDAVTFDGYASGSSITGVTDSYVVFDFQGKLVPRSLTDLKAELSLTKTANSIAYFDSNGALSTTQKNNNLLGGMGTSSANGWWWNINNDGGYIEQSYFAKRINATQLIATDAVRPSMWSRASSSAIIIEGVSAVPSAGDTLSESTDYETLLNLELSSVSTNGKLTLSKYATGSTITGTHEGFWGRSTTGELLPYTAEDVKEKVGVYVLREVAEGSDVAPTAAGTVPKGFYRVPDHLDGYILDKVTYTLGTSGIGSGTFEMQTDIEGTNDANTTFAVLEDTKTIEANTVVNTGDLIQFEVVSNTFGTNALGVNYELIFTK